MPEKQVTNEALASIEGIRSSMEHFQGRREGHEQVRKGMKANIRRFMSGFFWFSPAASLCMKLCFEFSHKNPWIGIRPELFMTFCDNLWHSDSEQKEHPPFWQERGGSIFRAICWRQLFSATWVLGWSLFLKGLLTFARKRNKVDSGV